MRRAKKVAPKTQLKSISKGTVKVDVTEAEEDWWGPEGPRAVTDRMQAFVDRLRTSEDDDIIVVGHSLFSGRFLITFASSDAKARDETLAHLSRKKLKNAAVARVTLNCSAARYPIVGVELAFPEEEDEACCGLLAAGRPCCGSSPEARAACRGRARSRAARAVGLDAAKHAPAMWSVVGARHPSVASSVPAPSRKAA